jgi:hypothetical protein
MYLNEIQVIVLLGLFGAGIYLSYKRGNDEGYREGYEDACVDVAHGNITVSLHPPKEDL